MSSPVRSADVAVGNQRWNAHPAPDVLAQDFPGSGDGTWVKFRFRYFPDQSVNPLAPATS